jgi:hypothetical protein
MGRPWLLRLFSRVRRADSARPRRCTPEVAALERRDLASVNITLTVTPTTLFPPNGRFVPVEATGTVTEFQVQNNKVVQVSPADIKDPPRANLFVVDEYRRIEPRVFLTLVPDGDHYSFKTTLFLQASRANGLPAGRRYWITAAAGDVDGFRGQTVAVQVPHDLTHRGQPPQVVPKKPTPIHRSKGFFS